MARCTVTPSAGALLIDDALDLARALVDLGDASVAHMALGVELLRCSPMPPWICSALLATRLAISLA